MFNASRSEAYDWENAGTGTRKRRALPKGATISSIFGPRLGTRNVPVEARAPAIRVETHSEGVQERRDARIALEKEREQARIRREKEILQATKAAQARREEFHRALSEPAPADLIDISQKLTAILAPSAALGAVGGLLAYLAPSISGFVETVGFHALLAGKGVLGAVAAVLAYPPFGIAVTAVFLIWAGLQVRKENLVAEKAARVRAR